MSVYWTVPGTGGYYNELEHHDTYEAALAEAREQASYTDTDDDPIEIVKHVTEVVNTVRGTRPPPTEEQKAEWARERQLMIEAGLNPDAVELTIPEFSVGGGQAPVETIEERIKRLLAQKGATVITSAGWCAPSGTMYETGPMP